MEKDNINSFLINDLLKIFGVDNFDNFNKQTFINNADITINIAKQNDNKLSIFLKKAKLKILSEFELLQRNQNMITHNQTIIPDTINPTLQLFTKRIICIDSQYRPSADLYSNKSNTDFTITLSEPIKNCVSLNLYSIQIPKTWYNVDSSIGNNSFKIDCSYSETDDVDSSYSKIVTISDGYYTISQLITSINKRVHDTSFNNNISFNDISFTDISFNYDSITRKTSINNDSINTVKITFFDKHIINSSCKSSPAMINFNLGWFLGFRGIPLIDNEIQIIINPTTKKYTSLSISQLYNPKYCMLVLDEFNYNHGNTRLINSIVNETKLSIPNYRNTGRCIYNPSSNDVLYIADNPRKLTQSQLYTVNSIIEDRTIKNNYLIPPTNNNILAVIPINDNNTEQNIFEFGTNVSINKRTYFGPVDIEKIRVKLLNEQGNLINLNNVDWSFTIHTEQLYKNNF
jgi:hypothetical protein